MCLSVGTTMWEHIMLDYGGSLMEHSSLWSLGVTYLSACPDHGRLDPSIDCPSDPVLPIAQTTTAIVLSITQFYL